MPLFIEGILIISMIFAFCIGLAIILKMGVDFIDYTKTKNNENPKPSPQIYLVTQTPTQKKKPKKKTKKPSVAFKGVVLPKDKIKTINNPSDLSF